MGIDRLQREEALDCVFRSLPLHDDEIPSQGMNLEEFIADPFTDVQSMMAALKTAAQKEGLELNDPGMICRTIPAHEVRAWAEAEYGQGRQVERAFFNAYFVRGINLGNADKLVDIVQSLGFSGAGCRKALTDKEFQERIAKDMELARSLEILVAPTFVRNGRKLVGYRPYNELKAFVRGEASPG